MSECCYSEDCYRSGILDYFGDRHHARRCGSCGNCSPKSPTRAPLSSEETFDDSPRSPRTKSKRPVPAEPIFPRELTQEETQTVRKILACAARMKGRFGKTLLAATLRGSSAKNVMHARLNELSTYGLLNEMRQEDITLFIDALCSARCLQVSKGEYPTVSITELGSRVMREQEHIELAIPPDGH